MLPLNSFIREAASHRPGNGGPSESLCKFALGLFSTIISLRLLWVATGAGLFISLILACGYLSTRHGETSWGEIYHYGASYTFDVPEEDLLAAISEQLGFRLETPVQSSQTSVTARVDVSTEKCRHAIAELRTNPEGPRSVLTLLTVDQRGRLFATRSCDKGELLETFGATVLDRLPSEQRPPR